MIPGLNKIIAEQSEQKRQMGLPGSTYENQDQSEEQIEILKMIFQYMKEKNKEIIKRFDDIKEEQETIFNSIEEIKKKLQ